MALVTALVLSASIAVAAAASTVSAAPVASASLVGEQRYLVRFVDDDGSDPRRSALAAAAAHVSITRRGATVESALRHVFSGAVIRADASRVEQLRADPWVASIEPISEFRLSSTQANAPWGLDRIDQRQIPLSGTYTAQAGGQGVRVYVVDSGIRADHVDFGNRVIPGFDAFITNGDGRVDCNGHGTHVAGTIGGTTFGVAKQVTLVPVRIAECSNTFGIDTLIEGLDWVLAEHARVGGPAVVNMSLGSTNGSVEDLEVTMQSLLAADLVTVVAAGNEAGDACDVSPARSTLVLTVSATDRADSRIPEANFGDCVDLFAPGEGIASASNLSRSGSSLSSGTSMATPHVAGAAAALRSAQSTLTARQVMAALITQATTGVVQNRGTGSPSRMLYLDPTSTPVPAPPANDDFSAAMAIPIGLSSQMSGSNILATAEPGEPQHARVGGGQSVWWTFTAPSNGAVALSTRGSDFDTVLAVYRGSAVGQLTLVVDNDDIATGVDRVSEVSFNAVSGQTYFIAVDGWEASWGSIRLNFASPWSASVNPPDPPSPTDPSTGRGMITTLQPTRLLDTRSTNRRVTTTPTTLTITGRNNIPTTGVSAVALNVTATGTTGNGYATVYPCGTPPTTSNLNFTLGQDIPNTVIAPLSANGQICLTASTPTHLIVDISAWFATS